jgi:hypothetical protein
MNWLNFELSSPGRGGRGRGSYQTEAPRGRFGARSLGRGSSQDSGDYNRVRGNDFYQRGSRWDKNYRWAEIFMGHYLGFWSEGDLSHLGSLVLPIKLFSLWWFQGKYGVLFEVCHFTRMELVRLVCVVSCLGIAMLFFLLEWVLLCNSSGNFFFFLAFFAQFFNENKVLV